MSRTPKTFSAYRVTASTEPAMPVGSVLIDKGVRLERDWTVMDFETGAQTWAVAERVGRLCATCRVKFKRATPLDHDGECSPETPFWRDPTSEEDL